MAISNRLLHKHPRRMMHMMATYGNCSFLDPSVLSHRVLVMFSTLRTAADSIIARHGKMCRVQFPGLSKHAKVKLQRESSRLGRNFSYTNWSFYFVPAAMITVSDDIFNASLVLIKDCNDIE